MPHPMTRLCDRFRLKEFDFHSFAPRRRVVDMSGGPRRGSDSPDLMYLSGKAIHTFWAPIRRTGPTFRRSSTSAFALAKSPSQPKISSTPALLILPYLTLYANSVH